MLKTALNFKEIFFFLLSFSITTLLTILLISNVVRFHQSKRSLSEHLHREVKVLCLVVTCPESHRTKAIHVKNTWGKRCNKLLFVTSETDPELETLLVPVKESRDILSFKTKKSFLHVHDHYLDDYDWFLKADDDNYIIMENLRYMLHQYRSHVALYFGHRLTSGWYNGLFHESYMAGGGYVLSKKAVQKFANIVRNKEKKLFSKKSSEDEEMGIALHNSAVLVDCRDEKHQKRFFPVGLWELSKQDDSYWYDQNSYYNVSRGNLNCCSDKAIAFHYIEPREMYFLEYAIYRVRPFGLEVAEHRNLPKKLRLKDIIAATDEISFAPSFDNRKDFHNMTSSEVQEDLRYG